MIKPIGLGFFTLFVLVGCLCLETHADRLQKQMVRLAVQSKSAVELDKLVEQGQQLRQARQACRIQLHEGLLPTACYLTLDLERDLSLLSGRDSYIKLQSRLDENCDRLTQKLPELQISDLRHLSPTCRKKVKSLQAVHAYRNQGPESTLWPEN